MVSYSQIGVEIVRPDFGDETGVFGDNSGLTIRSHHHNGARVIGDYAFEILGGRADCVAEKHKEIVIFGSPGPTANPTLLPIAYLLQGEGFVRLIGPITGSRCVNREHRVDFFERVNE